MYASLRPLPAWPMASGAEFLLAATVLLSGCQAGSPPSPAPTAANIAQIDNVGVVEKAALGLNINYTFVGGEQLELVTADYRILGPHGASGDLVIVGHDNEGNFIYTLSRQQGLSAGCFVENATGTDRGDYIELRGILWSKSPGIDISAAVAPGTQYSVGTRFCFNDGGRIAAVIPP